MQEYSDTPLQYTSERDGLDSLSDSIGVSQNAASPSDNRGSPGKDSMMKDSGSGYGSGKLIDLKEVPAEVIKPSGIRFASKLEGMKLRSGTLLQRHSLASQSSAINPQSSSLVDRAAHTLSTPKVAGHKPNFKEIIEAKKRASAIQQQHEMSIDIPDEDIDDHPEEAEAPFKQASGDSTNDLNG